MVDECFLEVIHNNLSFLDFALVVTLESLKSMR